jgi:hypothetical protein
VAVAKQTNEQTDYTSAGRWIDADFFLPRAANLPVEVDEGKKETRVVAVTSGDWRKVKRWRTITLSKSEFSRLKKEDAEQ